MRTKILLLLAIVSIQTGNSQVIDNKKETVIADSIRNVKAQEKAQNEFTKQNAAKIKEQKKQEKALKEAEQAQKKAEKAQKKTEKELRQREKKAKQREKALSNVEKNKSKIAKQQKAIKKHQKEFEKMERKGKISPDDEIKWKKKDASLRERLLKLEKDQEKNQKELMKLQ